MHTNPRPTHRPAQSKAGLFLSRTPTRTPQLTALLAAALLSASGCGNSEPTHGTLEPAPASGPMLADHAYTVRGQITQMPDPGKSPMRIHHEALPNFFSRDNQRVGMNAMVMGFPIRQGVSIDGLAVGSKILFTFEVTWQGEGPPWEITRITPLPDDTQLDFMSPGSRSEMDDPNEPGTRSNTDG